MPQIKDVIIHGPFKQVSVIVDAMPMFVYERRGNYLFAADGGWYDCYEIEPGSKGAFGGREFDIPMRDGTVIHAFGQIWSSGVSKNAPEPIASVGVASIEALDRCYCFFGGNVSRAKLDVWLSSNQPSSDYSKYLNNGAHRQVAELHSQF